MEVFKRKVLKHVTGIDALAGFGRNGQTLDDIARSNVCGKAQGVPCVHPAKDGYSFPFKS